MLDPRPPVFTPPTPNLTLISNAPPPVQTVLPPAQSISAKEPKVKQEKVSYPDINWTTVLIEKMLTEVEKPENRKVIVGTEAKENSSGDSKTTVWDRITEKIMPDYYALAPKVYAKRVKSKYDGEKKKYSKKMMEMNSTGSGVMPADGPNETTGSKAKSLWKKAEEKMPYFLRLHSLLSERPNVIPPLVITGIGPNGQEVQYFRHSTASAGQADFTPPPSYAPSPPATPATSHSAISTPAPPYSAPAVFTLTGSPTPPQVGDDFIDPSLYGSSGALADATSVPSNPGSPSQSADESHVSVVMKTPTRSVQVSVQASPSRRRLETAMGKVKVKSIPQKRSAEDAIADYSRMGFELVEKRMKMEDTRDTARFALEKESKVRGMVLEEKKSLLEEFDRGLITADEYRTRVAKLNARLDALDK